MQNTPGHAVISVFQDSDEVDQLICTCGSLKFTNIEQILPDREESVRCDGCGATASYTPGADAIYDLT